MSGRLLESGDELLIEDGTYRLLEELIITLLGGIAYWRDPPPAEGREPMVGVWQEPTPAIGATA